MLPLGANFRRFVQAGTCVALRLPLRRPTMKGIGDISRRSLLKGGSAAGAALTVMHLTGPSQAFGQPGEEVLPWLDQPAANPLPASVGNLLQWESLESWLTPA